jgi:hypothetical protein
MIGSPASGGMHSGNPLDLDPREKHSQNFPDEDDHVYLRQYLWPQVCDNDNPMNAVKTWRGVSFSCCESALVGNKREVGSAVAARWLHRRRRKVRHCSPGKAIYPMFRSRN